jgi:phosphohistidine phosphatase
MPRLLLLRHAKAERSQPGEGDVTRRLADRGRGDAAKVGLYMQAQGLLPSAAMVSPAVRTRETWELVARALKPAPQPVWDDRLYHASPLDILGVIQSAGGSAGTLLVVGHNPGLHEFAAGMIGSGDAGARQRLAEGMPTSALAVIDFTDESWEGLKPRTGRLQRFVTPKRLGTD